MEAARAALSAAGERQQKLDALIAEEQAKLNAIDANRLSRGSGRPPGAEARQVAAIERRIDRLRRGVLPDDPDAGAAPRADIDLRASARQHPQHHAAAGVAPQGRSSNSTGGGSSSGGGGADDDDVPDVDDDEECDDFKQYYRVPPNQRAWNEKVAHEYANGLRDRGMIEVEPPNLLRSCCDPALVGLGKVHICAPHLHLGLPLPPCPRHGWDAVDRGKLHSKGFSCGARRVYADPTDEWLVGTKIICDLCKAEKREKQSALDELEEEEADAEEIEKARAEVKAATYSYRSYNPVSMHLYAQRYYWYVASLEYVVFNRRTAVTRKLARRIMRALPNKTSASDLAEEVRAASSIEPRATPLLIVHWAAARTDIGAGGSTYSHFCCTWLLLPSLHPHLLLLPAHGEQGRGV
jgi:hypothetical protein